MTETTYTTDQAAAALGLSRRAVQKLCKRDLRRNGRDYVITAADLDRWRQRPGPGRPRTAAEAGKENHG